MTEELYRKDPSGGYRFNGKLIYYSERYSKSITLEEDMWSDGATGFIDLGADKFMSRSVMWIRNNLHHMAGYVKSAWFFVHDKICNTGLWDDGTKIDNWTASTVAYDILYADGYKILAVLVWLGTYLFGGGEARKNGMRRI